MRIKRYMPMLGAVVVSAAMLTAPTANASPGAFLYALESRGITIYNPSQAVNTGYRLCDELDYNRGDVVAVRLYRTVSRIDMPTVDVAAVWVMVAVEQLCPWHDHSVSLT